MKVRRLLLHAVSAAIITIIVPLAITPLTAHEVAPLPSPVCRVDVLVDGRPLEKFPTRGTTYIEALQGREYEIRLSNESGRRVAVALAIDGLNSIDAKHTDPTRASKWVLGPFETVTISGWQTGPETARRFFFTSEDHSYGGWLGQTDNLGVIEAVVFRERLPEPAPFSDSSARSRKSREPERAPHPSTESAPDAAGKAAEDELAATGIGREVGHRVRPVRLELETRPAASVRLRYEYREQLVRLGVLPSIEEEEALARRERASGFSEMEFAPDPYTRGR